MVALKKGMGALLISSLWLASWGCKPAENLPGPALAPQVTGGGPPVAVGPGVPGKPGETPAIPVQPLPGKVVLDGRVLVNRRGSLALSPEGLATLRGALAKARSCGRSYRIRVTGYVSTQPRSTQNLAASCQRAQLILNLLIREGLSAERITAKGVGAERPVASNGTHEGRLKNQRVELEFLEDINAVLVR